MAGGLRAALRCSGPDRVRGIGGRLLVALGLFLSGMALLALLAAVRSDYMIDQHTGRAPADVVSVGYWRTVVRFSTPDGAVHVPKAGVLYPLRLQEGTRVWVEYDTASPEVARVAGRSWLLGLLPVGTALLGVWAVLGPPAYWLLRRRRGRMPERPDRSAAPERV